MPRWLRLCLLFLRSIMQPLLRLARGIVSWDSFWWVAGIVIILILGGPRFPT